ncbi:MAG: ABC transporter ATP-binding protein [Mycoplasmataceae bacterium]|nr:ABC transporter ATP-binding protein [Mycoplasmataceae bacterium]
MKIVIKNLSKTFNDGTKALDNVSMSFKENKITGLIGFNGSGKTTTFNILSNFIEKYEGEVTIDGKEITRETLKTFSYLAAGAEPKNPIRVITHLYSISYMYGLKKKEADLIILPLAKEMDFTDLLKNPIKTLSKGNQQKIKIIAAMLNPNLKILLLDEPFDGLDPLMVNKIKKIFLRLKNVTIILTSHRMAVVQEMCSEFFVLKDGVLIDAKTMEDKTVLIEVNGEVPTVEIKKMKSVISISKKDGKTLIVVDEIKNFKPVNKKLMASPKYVFSSLKDKNLAEAVFDGYGENNE